MSAELQSNIGPAFANFARQFSDTLHLANDSKRLRVYETIDELPAFDCAIFVQDHHRHMFHVGVERVTERDHFDEWRKKHEEQRHRIAPDDDELLEQDRTKTTKRNTFHLGRFLLFTRVFCGKCHEDIFERWTDFMNLGVIDSDAA